MRNFHSSDELALPSASLAARQHGGPRTYIATAEAFDDEMRQRIARHQADRAARVPGMTTVEEPLKLAEAIQS